MCGVRPCVTGVLLALFLLASSRGLAQPSQHVERARRLLERGKSAAALAIVRPIIAREPNAIAARL